MKLSSGQISGGGGSFDSNLAALCVVQISCRLEAHKRAQILYSSLSKGNILITTIAINTNIARGLIPNPNARAGTAYLELEHSGFLEVE
jgi:hypothetical protein